MSLFKAVKNLARYVYRSRLFAPIRARRHIAMMNNNRLFYTLSPNLLIGLVRSFSYQKEHYPELLKTGCYLEFGLFKGFSIWFAELLSREFTGENFRLYGFDSFLGLPPTVVDKEELYWAPGAYACSREAVVRSIKDSGGDLNRITLVEGFYSDELFRSALSNVTLGSPAIVVIDADIYESCKIILDYFGTAFQKGTILLFDDFNAFERSDDHGERRALKEFSLSHPDFRTRELFDFGWHGTALIVEQPC